jgi:hypothetical protein
VAAVVPVTVMMALVWLPRVCHLGLDAVFETRII